MVSQPGQLFIGRQQELAVLTAALDATLSGRGQMVMLAGEPGIGKTRTAQELARQAQEKGVQVLWGWCYEGEGAPSYWPWVDTLRSYVQHTEPGLLRDQLGSGAAPIGEMIPEILEIVDGVKPAPNLEPDQARFRLFDAITGFLKRASEDSPILLVLDDLHWADRPSLLLLEFVAQQLDGSRIQIIGTYRDTEAPPESPLGESLARLARQTSFHRQPLTGLPTDGVGSFVQGETGITPSATLLSAIYAHTEGNPFFLGEVVRYLAELGRLDETAETPTDPASLGIPQGIRHVIGQRLLRLTEPCNQALTTAAVIGREFDFNLLAALTEPTSAEELLDLMDEAIAARIIEQQPGEAVRYQFRHALMQQTLDDSISTGRKVRLHARIAEALEKVYGSDPGDHVAELAHHFTQAVPVSGNEQMIRYTLLAGERALATYAWEEAVDHFDRGLSAKGIGLEGQTSVPDQEAANLLFGLARARSATGVGNQLVEAFTMLTRAFNYYANAGNVAQAVDAAEFPISNPSNRILGVAELLERAIALVPADSHDAGRLLSRYGGIIEDADGGYERALEALGRAITIARREGDVALEVRTLSSAALVNGLHLQWQESVDNGLKAIELVTCDAYSLPEMLSRYWASISLINMGKHEAARPHALVLRDLAERPGTPRQIASNALTPITYLSCLEGDWGAARRSSDRSLGLSPQNPQHIGPRALLEYETGDSAQGEVYLERLLDVMRRARTVQLEACGRISMAIPTIARITGISDRLEIAEAAAETVLSQQSINPLFTTWARAAKAMLAVRNCNQSAAAEYHSGLLDQRGTMLWTVTSFDRLLGLLSQTMGNIGQACDHFEEALEFCRKAGYRPELAWTCSDYSEALLERNDAGDQEKANFLLAESLAISRELGMRPSMQRVAALQKRCEELPGRITAYPGGLTQREVEVLRLICGGNTDREIGEELFISVKTVGNHVSNILNKTGAVNRTEAASYANQHGLVATASDGEA